MKQLAVISLITLSLLSLAGCGLGANTDENNKSDPYCPTATQVLLKKKPEPFIEAKERRERNEARKLSGLTP